MGAHIAKRASVALATVIAATFATFVLTRLIPGEPARAILTRVFVQDQTVGVSRDQINAVAQRYGLTDPLLVQYGRWLTRAAVGDLGTSIASGRPIRQEIGWRLGRTAQLAGLATVVSLALTFSAVLAARQSRRRWPRALVDGLSVASIGVPSFYLGVVLIILFSLWLDLLPVSGVGSWSHWILPVAVLAIGQFGFNASLLNGALDEALAAPYSITAKAKGLSRRKVLFLHALPNALVPLVPYLTLEFATLAGGVLVIEQLFGIPGIGAYLMVSLDNHDSPAFLATVAVIAAAVAGAGLLGDGLVALIDPRIRQGKGDAT